MFKNKILNKKVLIILSLILILIICIICIKYNNQKIEYIDVVEMQYSDFTNNFSKDYSITLKNESDFVRAYNLRWVDIKNKVKYQNYFLYDVTCEGNNCTEISISQMPISSFVLFSDIFLEPNSEQVYNIKVVYNGKKDKKGFFKGKIAVAEGVSDQAKYEEYMNERQSNQ